MGFRGTAEGFDEAEPSSGSYSLPQRLAKLADVAGPVPSPAQALGLRAHVLKALAGRGGPPPPLPRVPARARRGGPSAPAPAGRSPASGGTAAATHSPGVRRKLKQTTLPQFLSSIHKKYKSEMKEK